VKKHLEAAHFNSIPRETLQLYADVFNITVPDMLKILVAKPDDSVNTNTVS
jgi:hypothetical protein